MKIPLGPQTNVMSIWQLQEHASTQATEVPSGYSVVFFATYYVLRLNMVSTYLPMS